MKHNYGYALGFASHRRTTIGPPYAKKHLQIKRLVSLITINFQ